MTVQNFIHKLRNNTDSNTLNKELILTVNKNDIHDDYIYVDDVGYLEYADGVLAVIFGKNEDKINIDKSKIHSGDTRICEILEHLDVIDSLNHQISAILDLLMMTEESIEIQSIKTAAEMCMTMQDELMVEVGKIEEKWRGLKKVGDAE